MKPTACHMPAPAPRTEAEIYRSIRDGIARRFGLKNAKCLGVTLVTARKRIAQAEGQR